MRQKIPDLTIDRLMKVQVIPAAEILDGVFEGIFSPYNTSNTIIFYRFFMFYLTTDKDYDICMTKDCVTAASKIIQDMDASIDPCQDFYAFSCCGFIDNTNVTADKAQVCTMSQMRVSNFNSFFPFALDFNLQHYPACFGNHNQFLFPRKTSFFI